MAFLVKTRNLILSVVYKKVLKPLYFKRDPETVHDFMVKVGIRLGRHSICRGATSTLFSYSNPVLEQTVLGIHLKNPIGLSAGFDKNAELTDILPSVGFGFVEVGSITGEKCEGNPKPRLWRLPKSKSLVVYYGLKNDGCDSISKKLNEKLAHKEWGTPHQFEIPIGMSVAMTNCVENLDRDKAIEDYVKAFKTMAPLGSYVTINISCPNTQSDQPFLDLKSLDKLLARIDSATMLAGSLTPIFLKLSPDMDGAKIDGILEVAKRHRVAGLICSNLTKKRDNPLIKDKDVPIKGGLSGKVVEGLADNLLSYIYRKEGRRFILIGVGGVSSAEDAYRKIRRGATLIQLITGMIYEGPQVVSEINRGLVELLKRDGFKNVGEAVGVDV